MYTEWRRPQRDVGWSQTWMCFSQLFWLCYALWVIQRWLTSRFRTRLKQTDLFLNCIWYLSAAVPTMHLQPRLLIGPQIASPAPPLLAVTNQVFTMPIVPHHVTMGTTSVSGPTHPMAMTYHNTAVDTEVCLKCIWPPYSTVHVCFLSWPFWRGAFSIVFCLIPWFIPSD